MQYNKNAHGQHKKKLTDCRLRTLVLDGCEWSTSCSGYLNKERDWYPLGLQLFQTRWWKKNLKPPRQQSVPLYRHYCLTRVQLIWKVIRIIISSHKRQIMYVMKRREGNLICISVPQYYTRYLPYPHMNNSQSQQEFLNLRAIKRDHFSWFKTGIK
jgi:hypothetical protein